MAAIKTHSEAEATAALGEHPTTVYFSDPMPRVRLSPGYLFGIFSVAAVMVLLPLLYLGAIALLGWGTWEWATRGFDLLFPKLGGRRHVFWFLALLYVIPLLVAFVLLLFMVKNFFSRWRIAQLAVPLSHLDHPEIFRFLGQLCQQMGAPIPSRVDVTLAINASAGFRAGFTSLFGNDIMLTFGLPIVAAMDCREFAAVIAHELGHFTQRWAMRCEFITNRVHGWLFRGVFERGDFDDWIAEASNESSLGIVVFGCAWVAIGFTRLIMWLLLVLGHGLTSFMSREMEFHADACAVAVAGTDGFVGMLNKLRLLDACFEQARVQFRHQVAPRYPDDLSTYLATLVANCSGQAQGRVLEAAAKEQTRWFQSHPSNCQRTQRALQANAPGVINDLRPATILFNDFPGFSRALTLLNYQLRHGGRVVSPEHIFRVEPPAAQDVPDTSADEAAVQQYFAGLGGFLAPVLLQPGFQLALGVASDKAAQLQQAKATLHSVDLQPWCQALEQLDAQMLEAMEACALAQTGCEVAPEKFPLLGSAFSDLPVLLDSLQAHRERLNQELEPFRKAARSRLTTALSLLRTPAVAARLPDTQALNDEVLDLMHVFGKLSAAFPALLELRCRLAVLQSLLGARDAAASQAVGSAVLESRQDCERLLAEVQRTLGSAAYPFSHAKGRISVTEYARAKQYDADPARMTCLEVRSHLQMLFALYYRLLARLTAIALQVEAQPH